MDKLLIVDDEPIIRNGLSTFIKSTGIFDVIGSCTNGLEALDVIRRSKPDIVIVDVRMPVMDGLELIEECKRLNYASRFIILSGYGEFKYAQSAMHFGVVEYLLKPVNHEKLMQVLDKISVDIKEEREEKDTLKAGLINNILQNKNNAVAIDLNVLKKADILADTYQVAVLISDFVLSEKIELFGRLLTETKEFLDKRFPANCTLIKDNMVLITLIGYHIKNDVMLHFFSSMTAYHDKMFKSYFVLGIGNRCSNLSDLHQSYNQAINAVSESLYNKKSGVIFYDPEKFLQKDTQINHAGDFEFLTNAIIQMDKNIANEAVDIFFKKVLKDKPDPYVIFSFIYELQQFLYKDTRFEENCRRESFEQLKINLLLKCTLENIKNDLKNDIFNAIDILSESRLSEYGHLIFKIIKYIDSNFSKDITINILCGKFSINESYFCKLFKLKTGMTYNSYLTNLRVNKAKLLLRFERYKSYEIAELVGYTESNYFTKIFKKMTGMTPREYKNSTLTP